MGLDLSKFRLGQISGNFEHRKLATMAILARVFFYPKSLGYGRGQGSIIPDKHQLIPVDMLNRPWLPLLTTVEGKDHVPKYPRNRLLVSDEGGLGKTHAAGISAINAIKKGKIVIAIVPLRTIKQWKKSFKQIGLDSKRIYGEDVKKGIYSTTKVNIISKWAIPEKYLITSSALDKLKDVGLCILDEAHEGFIASNEEEDSDKSQTHRDDKLGVLADTIKNIFQSAKNSIALTATPIRHDWVELAKLMRLLLTDEKLQLLEKFTGKYLDKQSDAESWLDGLKKIWHPVLQRLELGKPSKGDKEIILNNLGKFCPLLDDKEVVELTSHINSNWGGIRNNVIARYNLARDLQPFGIVMNSTLRDDLGKEKVMERYRERISKSIHFGNPYDDFPLDLNSIERRCILNSLDKRYKRYEEHWKSESKETKDQIKNAWKEDPRLSKLKEIIEKERKTNSEDAQLNSMRGMVIFAHDVGTGMAIRNWLKENIDDVLIKEMYSDESDDVEETMNKNADIEFSLRINAASKSKDRKLSVLICGDGGAVGLDMEWATTMVHWDLWGGAENISQRSWRLDRRWPESGGPIKITNKIESLVNKKFEVIFFLTDTDDVSSINKKYRENRVLLGDRRFLLDECPVLIPIGDLIEDSESWTQNSRPMEFMTQTIIDNWKWCKGDLTDVSGLAELLNLKFLNSLLDLKISELGSIHKDEINNINILASNYTEKNKVHWGRIIALASPEERKSIKSLFGDFVKQEKHITSFGKPNIDSGNEIISILPNGRLSTILSNSLFESLKWDRFPFIFRDESILSGAKHRFYFIDLGLIKLYQDDLFEVALEVYGENLPSGLLQLRPGIFDISVGELSTHSVILERALSVEDNCTSRAWSLGLGAWDFTYDKHLESQLIPRIMTNRESKTFDYDTNVLLEKLQNLKKRGIDVDLGEIYSYMESIKNHKISKNDIFPLAYNNDQLKDGWNVEEPDLFDLW